MADADKNKYDIAVIGGGPAGIMAAIQAARNGLRVVLLEKNATLGKKFLLTGNGRCNLTNAQFNLRNLVENYHNGEFLYHAFSVFGPKETIEFFSGIGVKTKTEAGNRVFPQSNDAKDVLSALKKCLAENKVEIIYNADVKDIKKTGKKISKIVLGDREITAKQYILTTGGKSYSATGSSGFGYQLAEKLGHTIVTPAPALCPIRLREEWVKDLQGISLERVKLNNTEYGDIMFTHYGISGPAVLNISGSLPAKISIDLFPKLNQNEVLQGLEDLCKKYPRKTIKNILSEFVPAKFAEVFLNVIKIDSAKIGNNLPKTERGALAKNLKNFSAQGGPVSGWEVAMVTRGGISLKEIDHKTMKSKIVSNLLFAGEIIDVDGKTGGFNLQLCWSTGFTAGVSV